MVSLTLPPTRLLTLAVAAAVLLGACSDRTGQAADGDGGSASSTTAAPATTDASAGRSDTDDEAAADGAVDSASLAQPIALLDDAYRRVDGGWQGFDPTEHPVVLAWKDGNGGLLGALAINHPDPEALGRATAIDHDGEHLGPVHWIDELTDDANERLEPLQIFEFNSVIGGVDSFLMVAGGADDFFDPDAVDYGSTLLHEMFHRYQGPKSAFIGEGLQDVEGYAYTASNLELAALEDRALLAALRADDEETRVEAARRFAAIRKARETADDRVVLDNDQELGEGTARYVEHLLGGDDPDGHLFHRGNHGEELYASPDDVDGVKAYYGFGRFYASGAAVYHLLDLLGAEPDVATEASGAPPAELLAEALGVTDEEVEALVAEARRDYDPLGELADQAAGAAERAAAEPPVFGDIGGDSGGGGGDAPTDSGAIEGDGEVVELTAEEAACLDEALAEVDAADGEPVEIPDDVFERCMG